MKNITTQLGDTAYSNLRIGAKTRKVVANILIITLLVLDIPVPLTTITAQAAEVPASNWVNVPVKNDPLMQNLNIPADAATKGMWSGVFNWPMNGLHNMILPDGKVLTFGTTVDGNSQNGRLFDVWDPSLGFGANSHNSSYQDQQQDSFCATAAYLNDGRLLVTGGNSNNGGYGNGSTIYNPVDNTRVTASASTALPRWYATMITLPDSRKIVMGGMKPYTEGMWTYTDQAIANGEPSMTPEVYENGNWRSLFGAYSRDAFGPDFLRTSFPHAFVAPNGQVFGISSDKMWYLDPNANNGSGAITYVGNFKQGYSDIADPFNVGALSLAVMYDIGKIIQVGGNGGNNGDGFPASNMATSFDINNGTPVLTELPRMNFRRRYGNGIVLASGEVVITGGTTLGNYYAGGERDRGSQPVYAAEIWNPDTNQWKVGANAATIRVYHSISSLLTNGAILSTGGGTPGPVLNLNGEVYYPPYLFRQVGSGAQLAARPVIKAISGLSYGHGDALQLDMATADPISSLALVGLSNGTHSFNNGQRRIPLSFNQNEIRLTSTIPNANLTPPGYYQVVALDASGVPSYGVIVAIGQDVAPPNVPTTPYTPPDLSNSVSLPVINAGGTANYAVTPINGYTYSWNFGDGSPSTAYNADPVATHTYTHPGAYVVTLAVKNSSGIITYQTYMQAVATTKTAQSPTSSSPIAVEPANGRVWSVNPDNDSVSVIDANNVLIKEITVGQSPRTVTVAADGRIWVANKQSATISIINPTSLTVVQTLVLPRASQPHGLIFSPNGNSAYVALEATGQIVKFDNQGVQLATLNVGSNVRHLAMSADSSKLMVSRFITPPLPGESTANIDTSTKGGEVVVVNATNLTINKTITLRHSDKADNSTQGSGIPNYLASPVISPDGTTAWVPSKQDNIKRGMARSGQNLDFQNTVRAISSNIDMASLAENYAKRVDHDNSSLGSAAVYHPSGVYLFVALETSRQVAVLNAITGAELFRMEVGRAPQGLALSSDGNTLYIHEFMDRSVAAFDLTPLTQHGQLQATPIAVTYTVTNEKLPANVVLGKQLFYDAKDTRLARDSYMSCASCHNDGGHDGRVWDLTGFGEGLRNTIALKGRAAMGHGFLHWSANFDELQDFEGQIRDLAGGTGLMADAQYNTGTRSQKLGDKKAGVSQDLDLLADYVASLTKFDASPKRNADGSLTENAAAGKVVFNNTCASCHSGTRFTNSQNATTLSNI
jgi:YVTN family beta-propeller protein